MLTLKRRPVGQQQPQLRPSTPERQVEVASSHEEEIRALAYRTWQEAGGPIGDGVEFWSAAKTEFLRRKHR